MRGQILLKALEVLTDCALTQVDFIEAVLASGYGAGLGKLDYEFRKRRSVRERANLREEYKTERRRRLQNFLYQMKHDGLLDATKDNKLTVSIKGKQKIKELKNKLPGRYYLKTKTTQITIISFDIPEKLRRKRNWLREVIRNLGFKMIHQSVWMGKNKIPAEFIEDLENLRILEYVEILEATKSGSLKKLV